MSYFFDIEQPGILTAYLQCQGHIASNEQPAVSILAGGVSNRTMLVECSNGESWVIKQALTKLRVTVDWFSDPIRIHREALGLRELSRLAPLGTITPFLFEDTAQHILAMQAVPQPHTNWKTLLLNGQIKHDHIQQFARLLGTIQRRAYEEQSKVADLFADISFFESLRLEPYYLYTASQVPGAASFIQKLVETTRATKLTLVHGDYSPKNILVYHDKLILLDHEVIHFGDPAFDVGFSLTHLLSKAHHLLSNRTAFLEAAHVYWHTYWQTLGDLPWRTETLEKRAVQHTLACLLARVAGRSPLEYLTSDERVHQRSIVLALLQEQPSSIPTLIDQFGERID